MAYRSRDEGYVLVGSTMSPDGLASLKGRVGLREMLACKSRHLSGVDLLASGGRKAVRTKGKDVVASKA